VNDFYIAPSLSGLLCSLVATEGKSGNTCSSSSDMLSRSSIRIAYLTADTSLTASVRHWRRGV